MPAGRTIRLVCKSLPLYDTIWRKIVSIAKAHGAMVVIEDIESLSDMTLAIVKPRQDALEELVRLRLVKLEAVLTINNSKVGAEVMKVLEEEHYVAL